MKFLRNKRVSQFTILLLVMAMISASCGGGSTDGASGADADSASGVTTAGDDSGSLPDGTGQDANGTVNLDEVPEAPADMFEAPEEEEDEGPVDPWEVNVLTAKDDTGVVPVFDGPDGEAFTLQYEYPDGETINYDLQNPTYFSNPLSLLVVNGKPGDTYVEVMLPVRPNGTTAWVQTAFFDWSSHNYHVTVDIATNSVEVWKGDEMIAATESVSGRDDARTPVVSTYVDEKVPGPHDGYGSWILSLAAYSNDLTLFSGGLPKLAIHGTFQTELLGEYASSGCIRVPNDFIEMMAETVPVGATVDIVNSAL